MNLFRKVKALYNSWQEKRCLLNIRESLEFFGFDSSQFSDNDIKNGVLNLAKAARNFGLTAEQAAEVFRKFGNTCQETKWKTWKCKYCKTHFGAWTMQELKEQRNQHLKTCYKRPR